MIVSVAVVAYNEEKTLPRLLEDLKKQEYPHEKIEVLLIDSLSSDNTWAIMQAFAASAQGFLRVLLLKNEQKTLPYGCNVALKNYTGDAIVRIDAHASIPADFITKNVKTLQSGEDVCGGARPNIIDNDSGWSRTLLAAEQSMFGSSIASYRCSEQKRYVSSIFHGCYRREVYDKVGLYNGHLTRTEDNDMSYRIRKAGYRICYDPDIVSYQHTRSTLFQMLRQKYLNGYWIGKTMGVNPKCFSIFHFVPFCFVLGIFVTTALSLLGYPFLTALMWSAYGGLILLFSVMEILRKPFSWAKLALPGLFFLLHISYGIGTLVGLVEMPFWVRKIQKQERTD